MLAELLITCCLVEAVANVKFGYIWEQRCSRLKHSVHGLILELFIYNSS